MSKAFIFLGSSNAFLAVALGAYGAHGLRAKLGAEMSTVYEIGFDYHIIHSIGLILVGIIAHWATHSRLLIWAGGLLFAGIVLFCGSLYLSSLTGIRFLGAITPIGGLCFLSGWILLGLASLKKL